MNPMTTLSSFRKKEIINRIRGINDPRLSQRWEYKGKLYCYVDEIQVKNAQTREWDVHVLYYDEQGNTYSREINEFYQRFKQVNV